MRNRLLSRIRLKVFVGICLVLLGFLAYQQGSASIVTAADRVEQAWVNVRFSDSYSLTADVVIKTIPLPTVGNIGRFSKTDSIYPEGSNDLKGNSLEMALWGGGVSAANRAAAYQMRVRAGRAETRVGDGEWQTSDSSAAAFAPDGDFLAFLDVASNVALADDPNAAGLRCRRRRGPVEEVRPQRATLRQRPADAGTRQRLLGADDLRRYPDRESMRRMP